MGKLILFFILFPSLALAEVCNSEHSSYFVNNGESQAIEGGGFIFGFNGVQDKKLHFNRFCLTTSEDDVTYEFVADEQILWTCNSADCCKNHTLELQPNQSINIRADKETAMQWEIEVCYFSE